MGVSCLSRVGGREFHVVRRNPHASSHPPGRQPRPVLVAQQVFFNAQERSSGGTRQIQARRRNSNSDEGLARLRSENLSVKVQRWTALIDAEVGYSFLVYEVTITDINGTRCWFQAMLRYPGSIRRPGTNLSQLVSSKFLDQLRAIDGPAAGVRSHLSIQAGTPARAIRFPTE